MNLVVTSNTDCLKKAITTFCNDNFTIHVVKIDKDDFANLFENFLQESEVKSIDDIVVLFSDTENGRSYYKIVFAN